MNDRKLTYFKMNMLQAEIEMNAMIVDNRIRELREEYPSYNKDDFMALIGKYGISHNQFPFVED